MGHIGKNKTRAREMEEMLYPKVNQGAPHQERCHTWREINQMRKVMDEMRENMRRKKSYKGSSSPHRFPFHGFYQWSPFASKIQDAFLGFV